MRPLLLPLLLLMLLMHQVGKVMSNSFADGVQVDSDYMNYTKKLTPGVYRLNNEKRLIDNLLKNYQVKFGRPVNNRTESVVVYFGIDLIQLIDLDEKNQVLITNVKSNYKWKDNGLTWEPADFGGVVDIRLPVDLIWTPDVVLYNYADTRLEEKREVLATIRYDGTVIWKPPSMFKSTCEIDIVLFPYDKQKCKMKFGE